MQGENGRVAGKAALISGAASGIGFATAQLMAREGAGIVVADIDRDRGQAAAASLRDGGHPAAFVALDVVSADAWQAAVDAAIAAYGRLDILVNAAGIGEPKPLLEMALDHWRRTVSFGVSVPPEDADAIIDCRGLAARDALGNLRGVRGERLIVRSREVTLRRPIQLLHPRHSLYVVPWGDGRYMIGATVIETEDDGPVTVRSALELLGGAYALHSGFAEAEILEIGAGVRPAFPDNMPRVIVRDGGRHIFVNGAYRNGYLLAPVLAKAVAAYLDSGARADALVEVV